VLTAPSGLSLNNLHTWARQTTPIQFEIYKPMSPVPFIVAPLVLAAAGYSAWTLRDFLVPILTSRIVWGAGSFASILIFTTGHMWVKIKNAPYVQAGRDGSINWIAGGYSNQLGLEGQVMAALCEYECAMWRKGHVVTGDPGW
jgi:oligosaccharyltransferase complex subunit gamma